MNILILLAICFIPVLVVLIGFKAEQRRKAINAKKHFSGATYCNYAASESTRKLIKLI